MLGVFFLSFTGTNVFSLYPSSKLDPSKRDPHSLKREREQSVFVQSGRELGDREFLQEWKNEFFIMQQNFFPRELNFNQPLRFIPREKLIRLRRHSLEKRGHSCSIRSEIE